MSTNKIKENIGLAILLSVKDDNSFPDNHLEGICYKTQVCLIISALKWSATFLFLNWVNLIDRKSQGVKKSLNIFYYLYWRHLEIFKA